MVGEELEQQRLGRRSGEGGSGCCQSPGWGLRWVPKAYCRPPLVDELERFDSPCRWV